MSRPRIRSLKPELWQDEKVGGLTRDARLLFIGLITMADDEGRLRALPALVLGHVFPYDIDALKKVASWMGEITESGLIEQYEVAGTPYVQIIGWSKHQVINRPTPSDLPPGPFTENSVNGHGEAPAAITEPSVPSRAPADRIGSEGIKNPPLPPEGGRKRDLAAFKEDMQKWAASTYPDLPPHLVAGAVQRIRASRAEITPDRVRHVVHRMDPTLTERAA